ncbi:DUF4234 domain-containing protein, partial [Undibacterium rugosum]|uniref:DUF4234 domain-containing protein n=1 Tax=Undibacterium rugosum TaxID=2762291 RepID=UPI001B81F98C
AQLASLFKVSVEQIDSLLALPSYTIKKSISENAARNYQIAIEAAGGVCEIQADGVQIQSIEIVLPEHGSFAAKHNAASPPPAYESTSSTQFSAKEKQPTSSMATEPAKHDAAELKDEIQTKTLHLILLTIITSGLYPLLWLTRHHDTFNRITKKQTINMKYIVWMAIFTGICLALRDARDKSAILMFFGAYIVGSILFLIWAFRAKSALQNYALNTFKIDLRMNPVYTFFFTIFYINYCINDLPEVLRRQKILTGQNQM